MYRLLYKTLSKHFNSSAVNEVSTQTLCGEQWKAGSASREGAAAPTPIPGAPHELLIVPWPRGLQPWDVHGQGGTHCALTSSCERGMGWDPSSRAGDFIPPCTRMESSDSSLKERGTASPSSGIPACDVAVTRVQDPQGWKSPKSPPQAAARTWSHLWNEKKKNSPHLQQEGSIPHFPISLNSTFYEVLQQKTDLKNHSNHSKWDLELTVSL